MSNKIDVLMIETPSGVQFYTRAGEGVEVRIHHINYDLDGDFGIKEFNSEIVEPGWTSVEAANSLSNDEFDHYCEVALNPLEAWDEVDG